MGKREEWKNLSYSVVRADAKKMCFLQDMGIKFFTNSKVRQPVVCTGETVRRQPYIVNAGHVASAHHIKSSGNTERRKEISPFSLKEEVFLLHRHAQRSSTTSVLILNIGLA